MTFQDVREYAYPARGRVMALLYALLPPMLFLSAVALRYALVVLACAGVGGRIAFELLAAFPLAIIGVLLWKAWMAHREDVSSPAERVEGALATDRFLRLLGVASASLFAVSTLALWLTSFVHSGCAP